MSVTDVSSPAAIRVLHLVSDQDVPFPLLENLVRGLAGQGFLQTMCYLRGSSPETAERLRGVAEVVGLGIGRRRLRGFRPWLAVRLAGVLRERQIEVVHCQRHKPTTYGASAAALAGRSVRVLATVHGRERTRSRRRRLVNRVMFVRLSRIIAVSEAVRRDVLETNPACSPEKVVTVYNGIDADRFDPEVTSRAAARRDLRLEDGAFVIVTVGRLSEVKGQATLLEAFAVVASRQPDARLLFCGEGPLREELERQAGTLGVAERVVFLGRRNDVPRVLRAADVFALPSLSEGLPLSLLEAMACELPVLASRVGGIPEILEPDGWSMVEPGDAKTLGARLVELADRPAAARDEIGRRMRSLVLDRFTVQRMVDATAETYRACLSVPVRARAGGSSP